ADQGGDAAARDLQVDGGERPLAPVEDGYLARFEDRFDADLAAHGAVPLGDLGRRAILDPHPCRRRPWDGEALGGVSHRVILARLRASRAVAPRLAKRIAERSTSDDPQARVKPSGFASSERVQIVTGMLGTASKGLRLTLRPSKTAQVRISGAVSP